MIVIDLHKSLIQYKLSDSIFNTHAHSHTIERGHETRRKLVTTLTFFSLECQGLVPSLEVVHSKGTVLSPGG